MSPSLDPSGRAEWQVVRVGYAKEGGGQEGAHLVWMQMLSVLSQILLCLLSDQQ